MGPYRISVAAERETVFWCFKFIHFLHSSFVLIPSFRKAEERLSSLICPARCPPPTKHAYFSAPLISFLIISRSKRLILCPSYISSKRRTHVVILHILEYTLTSNSSSTHSRSKTCYSLRHSFTDHIPRSPSTHTLLKECISLHPCFSPRSASKPSLRIHMASTSTKSVLITATQPYTRVLTGVKPQTGLLSIMARAQKLQQIQHRHHNRNPPNHKLRHPNQLPKPPQHLHLHQRPHQPRSRRTRRNSPSPTPSPPTRAENAVWHTTTNPPT